MHVLGLSFLAELQSSRSLLHCFLSCVYILWLIDAGLACAKQCEALTALEPFNLEARETSTGAVAACL